MPATDKIAGTISMFLAVQSRLHLPILRRARMPVGKTNVPKVNTHSLINHHVINHLRNQLKEEDSELWFVEQKLHTILIGQDLVEKSGLLCLIKNLVCGACFS